MVFVTKWGAPLYPDTVTALMTKLINRHNRSATRPLPMPGCTTCVICTAPRFRSQASRSMSSPPLGHADPAVTLRVYAHVLREHAAGVGDIFAQAVNGSR
jgi:hypothetical protein